MRRLIPIIVIAVGLFAAYIDLWPGAQFVVLSNTEAGLQPLETKLGLDLKGGFEIRYQAQPVEKGGKVTYPTADQMARIRDIMERRVNAYGVAEPIVELAGKYDIVVQVPGAKDPTAVADLVGKTGQLSFVLLPPDVYGYINTSTGSYVAGTAANAKPVPQDGATIDPSLDGQFFGDQLDSGGIGSGRNTQSNEWVVYFAFQSQYANDFATWSGDHVGDYFAIVLDGKIISAPYIKQAITEGKGEISGNFTAQSAKDLATVLQYGALPFPVQDVGHRSISPTQAAFSFNQTLFAGAIGIGLVLLFMLVYYRLLGIVADLALIYYGLAVLAIFRIIPATLTLAGVAGFVLSMGMAVDANILIFERSKEELRTGKTLVAAIEAGFNRAWNSIFDSNMSSIITASILYMGGSPTVKGFALVLIIGVATSMFTAVTVSRTLLRTFVHMETVQRAWLYGVTDQEFQARSVYGGYGRREARGRV